MERKLAAILSADAVGYSRPVFPICIPNLLGLYVLAPFVQARLREDAGR